MTSGVERAGSQRAHSAPLGVEHLDQRWTRLRQREDQTAAIAKRVFVNVFAEKETSTTKKDILAIGEAIAKNIKQDGQTPKLIQLLPEEDLSERTLRYFHLHQVLNHHYFVSLQNILRLEERTNGLLATYFTHQTKEKTLLLLVQYPANGLAENAYQSFLKAYMPESSVSRTIKTESGKWTSAKIHQQYILIVFDAPSVEKPEQLIEAFVKKLSDVS